MVMAELDRIHLWSFRLAFIFLLPILDPESHDVFLSFSDPLFDLQFFFGCVIIVFTKLQCSIMRACTYVCSMNELKATSRFAFASVLFKVTYFLFHPKEYSTMSACSTHDYGYLNGYLFSIFLPFSPPIMYPVSHSVSAHFLFCFFLTSALFPLRVFSLSPFGVWIFFVFFLY